ncbi:hypothetical protein [Nonomuraea sp. NPDC049709]|uniref:hypothetical protein n=1 Tax=Nonomuraea sp. NPDC049709 TaxID=3154736 RepID=UPI0034165413
MEALNGRFDDHHGELTAQLLAQIDGLDAQIARLAARIEARITGMPDVQPAELDSDAHPREVALSAMDTVARLDEIPGTSPEVASRLTHTGPDQPWPTNPCWGSLPPARLRGRFSGQPCGGS